jgi:outer membrane protein assembly factor BamB
VCSEGECGCAKDKASCAGLCVEAVAGACGACGDECPPESPCDDGASHASDWPTLAADSSRTGYNAGERGRPPLTPGWALSLFAVPLTPATISGTRVFVSAQPGTNGGASKLLALDLATGNTLWSADFGNVSSVSQATVFKCRVYVQQSASSTIQSRLWSLRADSGEVIWSRSFPQRSAFSSPTVTETSIFTLATPTGGLHGFARSNGAPLFQNTETGQADAWVGAQHAADIFTFVAGKLRRHDTTTGNVLDTISVTWNRSVSTISGPVFSPAGEVYLVAPPTLYAFEAISKRLLWSHAANVSGMPALAEGRVLAFDSQLLTAFDVATGMVQWRSLDAEGLLHAPIVAAGFAYVTSTTATYAIDMSDGKVVWRADAGGWLTIGGGRLFIAGTDGILRSYLLTQP